MRLFNCFLLPIIAFLAASTGLDAQDKFVDVPSSVKAKSAKPEAEEAASTPGSSTTDSEQLQAIIEHQLAAIRSFDISRAYYAYTTKQFQKEVSLETFKQFVKQYPVLFRNKQANKDSITFKNNVAEYKGKLVSTDGEVYKIDVVLVFTDNEWKIHSIALTNHKTKGTLR